MLKGVLIVLVLVGHFMRPQEKAGLGHYLIYSFHIPMLLGVSGFLLAERSLRRLSFGRLLGKYVHRVGIPWAIALLVFFAYEHREAIVGGQWTMAMIVRALLYPWHHLWFIPAYVAMAMLTWVLAVLRVPLLPTTAAMLIWSFAWVAAAGDDRIGPAELYWLGDKRFYYYYAFFLLGYTARNRLPGGCLTPWLWVPAGILFAVRAALFYREAPAVLDALVFVALNATLLLPALGLFSHAETLRVFPLNFIGRQSLGIYLWHPLVTIACRFLVLHRFGLTRFYIATAVVTCLGLLPGIALLARLGPAARIVLGNIPHRRGRAPLSRTGGLSERGRLSSGPVQR